MPPAGNARPDMPRAGRLRALLAGLLLSLVSVGFCLLAIEAALRVAPARLLPAGAYGSGIPHPRLGMNVHGTPVLYTKTGFVRRVPNRDGFLDVDHDPHPPAGVLRVGLFGDSYVESLQVPLEQTFFRRAQALGGPGIEWLAFGMSGWGTLHAFRAFETFAARDGIGVAIYLFVENDPGDNDAAIKGGAGEMAWNLPAATLAPDGASYTVGVPGGAAARPFWFGPAKWLQRHSLLAHVVSDRLAVLRRRGVQVRADPAQRAMTGEAGGARAGAFDMNDLPDTWPPEIRARAAHLAALILRDWKRAAEARGIDLLVLYVPRGEEQLRGALDARRTWRPWLGETCADLGIPLVDPTADLAAALAGGQAVYADHWTAAGHEVIAAILVEAIRSRAGAASPGRDEVPGRNDVPG